MNQTHFSLSGLFFRSYSRLSWVARMQTYCYSNANLLLL